MTPMRISRSISTPFWTNQESRLMANRRYQLYRVIADDGVTNEQYDSYRDAFKKYQHEDAPKTMYGITEQGDVEVVLSK